MRMTLAVAVTLAAVGEGSRLLAFFPLPFPSHHFVYRPVLEELAIRGHHVLYVTSFPYKGPTPEGIEQLDISEYLALMPPGDFSWVNELAGLPDNPSYQLDSKSEMTNDMNFWQRLYNTYVTATSTLLGHYYLHSKMQPLMDQFFNYSGWESRPSIDVLTKNRSLILANASPFVGYPFPSAPHYKAIGGINVRPNKPLPQDIEKFMNEGKHGVIYMSFGSNLNLSHPSNEKVLDAFMNSFKALPQSVLLKYETDYKGELPPNVKLYKWMPQQDILAHKNVVLFISHGGLLSMYETIYHSVPILGVPIFGDQVKNMIFAESKGFGRMIRYNEITRDAVQSTLKEILSDKRYKEEMVRRSQQFRDRRHSPAEEAVYWIEHSLKYPFALTPKAASLSFLQLHMIDVISFVAAVFLTVIVVVCRLTYLIVKAAGRRKQQKKEKRH